MNPIKKAAASLLLCAAVCASSLPVSAAGMQDGAPAWTVEESTVAFAGQEWWVVGDAETGIYPQENSVTLLLKSEGNPYGNIAFRNASEEPVDGWSKDEDQPTDPRYYEGAFSNPGDYLDSTLQRKMVSVAESFPAGEQALITPRTLIANDPDEVYEITGGNIENQLLWPLSYEEWKSIESQDVRSFGDYYWLRSTDYRQSAVVVPGSGASTHYREYVWSARDAVRPALILDLENVLFSSAVTGGKEEAVVGGGFVDASAPAGTVKLTALDSGLSLTVTATPSQAAQSGKTLRFDYLDASTGEGNYLSALLTGQDGAAYYGRLAEASSAAGSLEIPLDGVADGAYTLKLFAEQANEGLYTDFCSEPVEMTVTVQNGSGTVSDFQGTIVADPAWWTVQDMTKYLGGEDGTGAYAGFAEPVFEARPENLYYTADGSGEKLEWDPSQPWYDVTYTRGEESGGFPTDSGEPVADNGQNKAGYYFLHVTPKEGYAFYTRVGDQFAAWNGMTPETMTALVTVRYMSEEGTERNDYISEAGTGADLSALEGAVTEDALEEAAEDNAQLIDETMQANENSETADGIALLPEETRVYRNNDPQLGEVAAEDVSLMFDQLLETRGEDVVAAMEDKAEAALKAAGAADAARTHEFKYLDLVEHENGNVWVSSSEGSLILWPYPEGTGAETEFELVHFRGLHREYGLGEQEDVMGQIADCQPEVVEHVNTEDGILFYVPQSGFSPFSLSWEHAHDWDSAWSSDADSHWYECLADGCPISDPAQMDSFGAHQFGGWTVVKEPTAEEDGVRLHSCTVCGYTAAEPIPAVSGEEPADDSGNPQMGDRPMLLWGSLGAMALAAAGLTAVIALRRKRAK